MKKDWTYKKFEDCIENVKYTTKIQSKDYMASGEYPIISQEEELVSGYWNKNEDVFSAPRPLVVFGDHTRVLKYIDFDFVLGADGVKILLPIEDLEAKFLYYFLKWYNVPNLGYSRHYKLLKEISIPIPPLSIQHSIVAELDLLHSVISKKKEQLRELDNLAQSLFYQMFGDPITNPMGWEIKKLGEVFEIGSSKRVYQSEWTTSGVPFYRAREIVKLARDGYVDNELFITEELYDKYAEKYGTPKVGDILVTAVGTLGVTYIVNEKDRFYYKDGNIICLHHKGAAVDSKYVDFCFKTPFVREQIDNWSGATVGTFTIVKANTTLIPLPPLSLQQSFAARVSAIEVQKALVRQSIEEARTLLASRMQYYFE